MASKTKTTTPTKPSKAKKKAGSKGAPSPMRKILIANRGEIAMRVIRAARGLGLRTAVVYSDADASALFVQEADEAVHLPGTAAADTYLVIDKVLEAAARVGADAIHPGYGFLSENAAFADACEKAGITFIGPPSAAIRSMGDKVESKAIMDAGGVPILKSVTVTDDSGQDIKAEVADIGLPAIVKASAGGGGRGMRIVDEGKDLLAEIESAQREAKSAFGNGTVFIEKYVSPSRHIEVQVIADSHGNAVALFERECSIQRRHQKVVEEAPSPVITDELRGQLLEAAVNAAKAVDYRGVGTVEFVANAEGTSFYFLEMNTRLQVEHPVTELVTGLDLVRLQIQVAAGEPLPPEVLEPTLTGHAIEVRLCAEDPAAGYLPVSGTFSVFDISGEGIRVDTGVTSGSEVSPFYDSMVAKVIAYAENRQAAAQRLADALERARLHGITTNRDLLVQILRSEAYLAGDTTTDFLERIDGLTAPLTDRAAHEAHAAISAVAAHEVHRGKRLVQQTIPSGWRNNRSTLEPLELQPQGEDETISVGYDLSRGEAVVEVGGERVEIAVHGVVLAAPGEQAPGTEPAGQTLIVDATLGGVRRRYTVTALPSTNGVDDTPSALLIDSTLGSSALTVLDRLPDPGSSGPLGGLSAPMPGLVVRVLVSEGDQVEQGQPLLVLEAMKMEHTITAPHEGTVSEIAVSEGTQVESGAILAAVTPADAEG